MFLPVIVLGAIPCAFALRHQRLAKLVAALPTFGLAVIVGCVAMCMAYGRTVGFALNKLPGLFADTFCLTLVGFVVEEVVFRGAIDSHVSAAEDTPVQKWLSAIFVSLLWGLWHLPLPFLYPSHELRYLALVMLLNVLLGVPISFCWRKSGTLLLPSIAHALGDSIRNNLLM
jgi:membrane protease YdiL (CAAX protease family)